MENKTTLSSIVKSFLEGRGYREVRVQKIVFVAALPKTTTDDSTPVKVELNFDGGEG